MRKVAKNLVITSLVIMMACTLFLGSISFAQPKVFANEATALEGAGTEASPWIIADAEDFALMASLIEADATYADDHYKMAADVDFTDKTMVSIGKTSPFSGIFDGNDHIVKNLAITEESENIGLFSLVDGGTIKNLGVIDSTVKTTTVASVGHIGALIGRTFNAKVYNCYVNNVTVEGFRFIGGLIGGAYSTQLYNCYAINVNATATKAFAGLCGGMSTSTNKANPSSMDNIYVANVTLNNGSQFAGEIIGYDEGNNVTTPVNGTNVYYCGTKAASGNWPARPVTAVTEEEVTNGTLLNVLNTNLKDGYKRWVADENGYPTLSDQIYSILDEYDLEGEGTEESPWLINDAKNFQAMSKLIDSRSDFADDYYQMTKDVDFLGESFDSIGKGGNPFRGVFDGCGFKVQNLTILEGSNNVGLFGYVKGGTVKNVGVVDSTIIGMGGSEVYNVGGIVGNAENATILNCYADNVSVTGSRKIGGIVGLSFSSTVANCYSRVTVTGNVKAAAGICGSLEVVTGTTDPSIIDNVYTIATINCADMSGVVVGYDEGLIFADLTPTTNVYYCGNLGASGHWSKREELVTKMTEAEMSSGALLVALNQGLKDGYKAWIADENGYPVLSEQYGPVETLCPACGSITEVHEKCEYCEQYLCQGDHSECEPEVLCPACGSTTEAHEKCEYCEQYLCQGNHSNCGPKSSENANSSIESSSEEGKKGCFGSLNSNLGSVFAILVISFAVFACKKIKKQN